MPQLLIKQGLTKLSGRFRGPCDETTGKGAICSQSYISVHTESKSILESAVLSYNSVLAVYFLLLTSGRLASYRPEPLVEEMRAVPLAPPYDDTLAGVRTLEDVDERVRKAFGFKDAEWTLVDDLFRYTLPDFKGDQTSPGRQITERAPSSPNRPGRSRSLPPTAATSPGYSRRASARRNRSVQLSFRTTFSRRFPCGWWPFTWIGRANSRSWSSRWIAPNSATGSWNWTANG